MEKKSKYYDSAVTAISKLFADKSKKISVLSKDLVTIICGDYDGETETNMKKIKEILAVEGYPTCLLKECKNSGLDDYSSEKDALEKADLIVLVDGKNAGTITETSLIMNDARLQEKCLMFYNSEKKEEEVYTMTEYLMYFPKKFSYANADDLVKKAVAFTKQEIRRKATNSINNKEKS